MLPRSVTLVNNAITITFHALSGRSTTLELARAKNCCRNLAVVTRVRDPPHEHERTGTIFRQSSVSRAGVVVVQHLTGAVDESRARKEGTTFGIPHLQKTTFEIRTGDAAFLTNRNNDLPQSTAMFGRESAHEHGLAENVANGLCVHGQRRVINHGKPLLELHRKLRELLEQRATSRVLGVSPPKTIIEGASGGEVDATRPAAPRRIAIEPLKRLSGIRRDASRRRGRSGGLQGHETGVKPLRPALRPREGRQVVADDAMILSASAGALKSSDEDALRHVPHGLAGSERAQLLPEDVCREPLVATGAAEVVHLLGISAVGSGLRPDALP